ncbi:Serine protease 3 [Smittium mucronatum]|uniref:Serine protease 3 n=1 Tax=Smittium mucronatum TaxID=133383 RepID=A0A1R0H4F0_9FUNG|nr:Serine protease 3 [Smittium mucronatum]
MKSTNIYSLLLLVVIGSSKADQQNFVYNSDAIQLLEKNTSSNLKITNGNVANLSDFPYASSIYADLGNLSYTCTGSLIGRGVIMTAAHCLYSFLRDRTPASSMLVSVGSSSNALTNPKVYNVSYTIPYPDFYKGSIVGDIGLIMYNQTEPDSIPYAKIYGNKITDDIPVKAAGWGVTSYSDNLDPDFPVFLMSVSLQISSTDVCSDLSNSWTSNDGNLICAETVDGKSICSGDSGGPLAYSGVSPMPIIGITSFSNSLFHDPESGEGYKCGSEGEADYFTHAFNYIDWIVENSGLDKDSLIYYELTSNSSNSDSVSGTFSGSTFVSSNSLSKNPSSVSPSTQPLFNSFTSALTLIICLFCLI